MSTPIEILRTAVPIWSPAGVGPTPLLATGTVSGALDASFSSDSVLELWDPFGSPSTSNANAPVELHEPSASINVQSRFNRLAWGYHKPGERDYGVLAAGLESGEIAIWDPNYLLHGHYDEALIAQHQLHQGQVRGLDFNRHQTQLLASGASNGEIYIWDLNTPNKPFSPGSRSRSIEDVTSLSWNSHVAHVLATGSNSGYTVVWDLKSKREVTALSYSGMNPAAMNGGGGPQAGYGMPWGAQGKRSVSCVQWHPDNPTKLVTASDDDSNPVILLWDLRNWKEPERILTGHEKGVLSLSWCSQDSDLLLSSGKDGRTIAWNPNKAEIVAELTPSSNWSFDVQWCPRNPSLLSTATLEGKVSVQSIQKTSIPEPQEVEQASTGAVDGAGIFEAAISANAANYPTLSLTQPPKWLQRPASVAFGFGGKLVSVSTAPGAAKSKVKVSSFVAENDVVERAVRLQEATDGEGSLAEFCEARSAEVAQQTGISASVKDSEAASWRLLETLFTTGAGTDARDELIRLLGFNKEEVRKRIAAAIKPSVKASSALARGAGGGADDENDDATSVAREPLVTFAENTADGGLSGSSDGGEGAAANARDQDGTDAAPSISEALVSEGGETEVTEPSLFGGDDGAQAQGGAPQTQAAADFYRQIGSGRPAALPEHVLAARQGANSSVAATVGSASSVASLNLKATTFKIYPAEESEVDTLITKALVLGDFESAVDIALSNERFSDAILLAVRGGPELLARAQKAYFEQRTASFPYLRIFQSIVANDLSDVVQNADLSEWKEVFVVLCTFATADEFASLLEQLGQRLEYQYTVTVQSPTPAAAPAFRRDATLCYLAAGRLERVVTIWLQQMDEEEKAFVQSMGDKPLATVKFAAHARALQAFIEKVTVFQQAVSYVDSDLSLPVQDTAEAEARTYKLSSLYDRYMEYAELLASQGLVTVALKYVAQTPASYKAGEDDGPALTRKRLMRASGMRTSYAQSNVASAMQPQAQARPQYDGYSQQPAYQQPAYQQPQQPAYQQPAYQQPAYQQPQPATSAAYDDPYRPSGGAAPAATAAAAPAAAPPQPAYSQPAFAQPAFSQPAPNNAFQSPYDNITSFVPAPPAPMESAPAPSYQAPPPAAARPPAGSMPPPPPRAKGAWNDIPQIDRRPTPSQAPGAPGAKVAITSPFPNASPSMSPAPTFGAPGASGQVPPPPPSRGATRTPSQVPPPPRAGAMPPPAAKSPPPPAGYRSPPTSQPFPAQNGMQRGPSAGPYAAPASAAGPYMPAPPVASQAPPGPYAPPPAQAAPGPYAPQRPPSAAGGGAPAQPPPPPRGAMPPPRAAPPPGRAGVSPAQSPAPPAPAPARPELPKNKYPPGDRSHIPEANKPIFSVLSREIGRLRQIAPPNQKKVVDDLERRLNVLFDGLNEERLSPKLTGLLHTICQGIEQKNQGMALNAHLHMLQSGEDVAAFQAPLKLVIQRMER